MQVLSADGGAWGKTSLIKRKGAHPILLAACTLSRTVGGSLERRQDPDNVVWSALTVTLCKNNQRLWWEIVEAIGALGPRRVDSGTPQTGSIRSSWRGAVMSIRCSSHRSSGGGGNIQSVLFFPHCTRRLFGGINAPWDNNVRAREVQIITGNCLGAGLTHFSFFCVCCYSVMRCCFLD